MSNLTEQQKARIVELARMCERNLACANIPMVFARGSFQGQARDASAEAFRIAQGAT